MKKKTLTKKEVKQLEVYKKDTKAKPGDLINKMNAKKRTAFMGMV